MKSILGQDMQGVVLRVAFTVPEFVTGRARTLESGFVPFPLCALALMFLQMNLPQPD